MSAHFSGKVVIVTGGAGAIGSEIVQLLLDQGCRVAFCDLDAAAVDSFTVTLKEDGYSETQFLGSRVDVSVSPDIVLWLTEVQLKFGDRVHGVVNNAAKFVFGKVEEVSDEDWMTCLATNVKGYAMVIKAVLPLLSDGSSIGAIEQLSKCVALDYGSKGIRCNTVCPGTIFTPATSLHAKKLGIPLEELTLQTCEKLCIKRLGTTRDVANCVSFLLSDASAYVTGSSLVSHTSCSSLHDLDST